MVKASGQIEQELGQLQQKTESMSDALNVLYEGYLQALVEASKRQLVLAAYYLCTQAYPDRFLALSWDKRNQLQSSLQVLSAKIEGQLAEQRDRAKKMSRRRQQHNGLEFLQRLLESRSSSPDSLEDKDDADRSSQVVDAPKSGGDILDSVSESAPEATPKRRLSDAHSDESYTHKLDPSERQSTDSTRDVDDRVVGDSPLASHGEGVDSGALDDSLVIGEGLFDDVKDSAADDGESRSASRGDALANDDLADNDLSADIFAASELGEDGFDDDGRDARVGEDDDFDFEMEVPAADQRLTLSEEEDLLSALEGLARRSLNQSLGQSTDDADGATDEAAQPLVPMHLVKQQVLLEKAIRDVFSVISEEANELLQKADVMPAFPKALMAAAVDARGMGDPVNAVPNVVKMSVRVMQGEALLDPGDEEDEDDRVKRAGRRSSRRRDRRPDREGSDRSRDKSRRSQRSSKSDRNSSRRSKEDLPLPHRMMARDAMSIEALPELAAISLRLGEVEFSDPTVSAWRSRLRQKLNDLKQLGMRYKKTQRALETAQAEDAWRSSWTVNKSND